MINAEAEYIFSLVGSTLEKFAENNNLLIEKNWHNASSWSFSFKHPKGGAACCEIIIDKPSEIEIYGYWWIDDFDNGVRYSRTFRSGYIKEGQIPTCLDATYNTILSWETDSLSEKTEGFKEYWHRAYTKEQFEKFYDKYPRPKLEL